MRNTPRVQIMTGSGATLAAAVIAVGLALPTLASAEPSMEFKIIVGGINDPANTERAEDAADAAIPQLPVVYDDGETQP